MLADIPSQEVFIQCLVIKSPFLGAIKIKPPTKTDTYEELRCTDEDKAIIDEIIGTMAKYGYWDLYFNYQVHLRALGRKIDDLHPYKFWSYILNNSQRKMDMKEILSDYFKKMNFVEEFVPHFELEHRKGTMLKFLPNFAKEINVPEDKIRPFVEKKDWEGLVVFLING